jgi:outer membrane protein TolC
MRILPLALLLFAQGVAAAPGEPSKAPALPTDPLLERLIEQSLAARPELRQARAIARAERSRVAQAGAPPDPMIQLGVQNEGLTRWEVGTGMSSWYQVMASQTVPWPGKLRLRGEIAELGASQADQGTARVRLSTEADVRRAYLGLLLARDRMGLLDRLDAISQKSVALARTRYEAGNGAQSDVLRAQLELNRIKQRRWALQVEAENAVQSLNRLRGHPLDEAIETPVRLPELPVPVLPGEAPATQDALDRSPELAAARLAVTLGERSVDLSEKGWFPDLTVTAGVMPQGGIYPLMWLVNVGGPLPIFAASKQSRAVAEAEARVAASSAGVEALEQVLRLRVQQRRAALRAALETLRLYKGGLLVQSEATAESTRSQYEVGKVTFASVLEANTGLIGDQDSYLAVLAVAQSLQIDALEVSLAPVSSGGAVMGTAAPTAGAMELGAPASPSGMAAPAPAGGGSPSNSKM